RSATLSIGGISYQVTQAPPDTTPPTVAIVSPAANFTTSNATLQVQGTASDNTAVSRVEYRVGTNAFATATGTTAWSALVSLVTGTNIVSVRSVDTAGNVSTEVQRPFVCVTPGTITVTIRGRGSVKGATNGQHLVFGKAYSLSALPDPGYAFSNWTGTVAGHASRLDFVMMSNVQVTANFVPNPFAACKGAFQGLFYETNQVQQQRSGYFSLALTDKGSYSASLLTRGWKLKAKGKFDLAGFATNQISAPDGSTYTVTWSIALDGSDTISGNVGTGGWASSLSGDRLVFNAKTNPAPQAGRYTFVILGTPGQADAPGGDGYGTVTVATKGTATLSGYLADRTKFVVKRSLSKFGNSPVYVSLYSGKGAVLGWIAFRDRPTTDLDAVLSWTRPSLAGSLYPGGFVSESAMIGSLFEAAPGNSPVIDLPNPTIRFEGGNLTASFTNTLAVAGGGFSNLGANALTLKVTPPSGLFRGTVQVPGSSLTLPFNGVVVQKTGVGCGYFVGTNETGRVTLESAP
ncbi:MAG TPA: Ig-like domain-containing protein, partial [Verrucomicrobiae bacterium]|nr:Ig-like domain-containing protein [Verrucomicrobiae bacterium]